MEPVGRGPVADRPRRTGRRAELADGWRLAQPTLQAVITPRRLRTLLVSASAVAVVVSAIVHPLVGSFAPGWRGVVLALGVGVLAGLVPTWILPLRWRGADPTAVSSSGAPKDGAARVAVLGSAVPDSAVPDSAVPGSAVSDSAVPGVAPSALRATRARPTRQKDGDEGAIRRAWASRLEPEVPVDRRLAAAAQAERLRDSVPPWLVTSIAPAGVVVPFVLIGIGLLPHVVVFVALVGAANGLASLGSLLTALGRTRHAIETRPDVPDHLEPNGARKPRPWRSLGTDHPDDYA